MGRLLLSTIFFTFSFLPVMAQTVTGQVTSADDPTGLPGVNILIKGTGTGTTTDLLGNYTLVASSADTLVFSFIGLQNQEVRVGSRTKINVLMEVNQRELEEIIVTGYSSQNKRDVIGSIASVSAEDFKEAPVTGLDQALQGRAAGVQVTQSSGTPGGGISVKIRGATSISASNRPLFIVDGVPVANGSMSLRSFGGQNDNALSAINPNDIQDIQILKDASAKAIYGSRAANGVVLVTTKRGSSQKTKFNFSAQRGIIDITKKVELLNSSELLNLQREAVLNSDGNPDALGLVNGVTDGVDTDWLDEILRTGILQQYQLSLSGGGAETQFYVSGGYRQEEGVQHNNQFERFSFSLNLDHKISEKAALATNLSITKVKNDRVKGDNFLDGVYSGAIKSLPYFSPYDEHGKLYSPGNPGYAEFPNFNPVAQAVLPRFESRTNKLLGGINYKYEILQSLTLSSKASIDYNSVNEDQFEPSTTAIGGFLPSVGGQGYGVYSTGEVTTLINTNVLNYRTNLGDHNITALLGTEIVQTKSRSANVQGRLFPSDDFTYIASAGIVDNGSSVIGESSLVSAFSNAIYDLRDKYFATASLRADGSSRFGPGNRFAFFPAISVGWRLSNESFLEGKEWLDELRVRGSYGYTGNERIGDFRFLGTWGATTYNGASGTGPAGLGNPDLRWESTREINLGLDVAFFQGRIQVIADVYNNLTSDLLLTEPFPFTTGFGGVIGNIGNVSNKGIETSVTTVNFDKDINWTTSFNISKNLNKVVALADSLPLFRGYSASGVNATSIITEGKPLGTFWGLEFLGVDPATGDAIYTDLNEDGDITEDDAMVIGSTQADWIGGITNSVRYRGFDLSVFMQFSLGNEMLNFSNTTLLNTGENLENNQVKAALKRWQEPGDITSIPKYENGNTFNSRHSSRFIEDGSYLRLKNVSAGYNLPDKLISRFGLTKLRIYASGANLWTLTRYTGGDPEVSTLDGSVSAAGIDFFTLPQVRTMMVGINLEF